MENVSLAIIIDSGTNKTNKQFYANKKKQYKNENIKKYLKNKNVKYSGIWLYWHKYRGGGDCVNLA